MVRDFKKLDVYNTAYAFVLSIYKITKDFPKSEVYGITNQLRRAASSITANIAEGSGRSSDKEFMHFLFIALGSVKECEHFLMLSKDLGYLSDLQHNLLDTQINQIGGKLNNFIKTLKITNNATSYKPLATT
ncbi:MAG: four helix bundle protein [Candidatus Woesearchaeota archaeon]